MSNYPPSLAPLKGTAGFAIPVALFVLVVMSMIAMAGIYVARTNLAASLGIRGSARALYAADAGAVLSLATWNYASIGVLTPGDSVDLGWDTLPDGASYRTVVQRVDDGTPGTKWLFRVRTTGRPAFSTTARRDVVTMVQAGMGGDISCDGALKVQGRFEVSGRRRNDPPRPEVNGIDLTPGGWAGQCTSPTVSITGAVPERRRDIRILRNGDVDGFPAIQEDRTISDASFSNLGGYSYAQLAAMADITYTGNRTFGSSIGPSQSGGVCNTASTTNWGEPLNPASPCWDHLPIIHFTGSLTITGTGRGQGILLVDGNLVIRGDFDFYGVIVVLGRSEFRGRGAIMTGGILIRNGAGGRSTSNVQNGSQLQYSSCAVERATSSLSSVSRLPGRNWFEIF
jgi:hypothetical protein